VSEIRPDSRPRGRWSLTPGGPGVAPTLLVLVSILLLSSLLAPPLAARTTGAVEGFLLDVEEERPMSGVTVTLEGPALPRSRTTTSGSDGRFRFLGLPPGVYLLTATKPGYTSVEQTEIQVEVGRTVSLDFEMFTAFDEEEVLITGAAPVLDITSAAVGDIYDLDLFDHVPLDRTLLSLSAVTPTTVPAAELGGAVSIAGGAPRDNVFRVDGLDVTSPVDGDRVVALPFEQVARIAVATGGQGVDREGALGGVVQLLTRHGGPRHHGRLSLYGRSRDLAASPPATVTAGRELGVSSWDAGLSLGGPVVAERLWYFAAADRARSERVVENRHRERFETVAQTTGWTARLTWQPAGRHLLTASAFGDPTDLEDEPLADAAGRLGHDGELGAEGWAVQYQGALGRKLFFDLHGGRFEETLETRPLAEAPLYEDLTSAETFATEAFWARRQGCGPAEPLGRGVAFAPGCVGGSVARLRGRGTRDEAGAVLTWFSGGRVGDVPPERRQTPLEHAVRIGFDGRSAEVRDDTRYPGAAPHPLVDSAGVLVDPGGLTGQRWLLTDTGARLFELEGTFHREYDELAVFVEDRVRLGEHVVLRVGLRAERLRADLRSADGPSAPELELDLGDTLVPRLSVVWDIQSNGRTRLYLHFGRYVDPRPPAVEGLPLAARSQSVTTFAYPEDGSLPTATDPGRLLERVSLARELSVAPDLAPPELSEARLGMALEPLPDFTIGVSAVLRELEEVVEDVSLDGGETYVLLNPGGTLTHHPVTGEALPSVVFLPEPRRDYRALEVRLDKGFGSAWQLHGSYTFAESEGNYGASIPPPDGALLTPELDTRFDLPGALPRGDGVLVGDRRHQWRVYGSYRWASRLTTGLVARYLSGAPTARLGTHPRLGRRSRFIGPPDAGGRLPELWSLDLHLQYPVELGEGMTLDLVGDLFNLSGREEPVRVVEEWTFAEREENSGTPEPRTNPAFRSALEYQQPRSLRLGVRLRW